MRRFPASLRTMQRSRGVCWFCLLAIGVGGARAPRTTPAATSAPAAARPVADVVAGNWRGYARFQGARLDFSVRVWREGAGFRASMSCPDMMLLEQPLDSVRVTAGRLRFVTRDEHPLLFDGAVSGDSLRGASAVPAVPGVVAAGTNAPPMRFALGRSAAPASPPWHARELRIPSGTAQLAATLYLPGGGAGARSGIVLLQGSSAQSRREDLFHADLFARAGLAVLLYDKRGHGGSTGDYAAATYDVLADDAAAAVKCLQSQPEVDPQRVGVWGMSQGGFISPLVAARVPSLKFIIAVSPPGVPIGEIAAYQDSVRLVAGGFDAADIVRAVSIDRRLLAWLRSGKDETEMAAVLTEAAKTPWRRASSIPGTLPAGAAREGWYWRGRTADPTPWWREVQVPALVLFGEADELIPAKASARAIEKALHQAKNKNASVLVYPDANHALRRLPLAAGGAWDWPRAVPGYLDLLTTWVLAHS